MLPVKVIIPVGAQDKTSLSELLPLSRFLLDNNCKPYLIFETVPTNNDSAFLNKEGIEFRAPKPVSNSTAKKTTNTTKPESTAKKSSRLKILIMFYIGQVLQFLRTIKSAKKKLKIAEHHFKEIQPHCLLTTGDRKLFHLIPELIKLSRQNNVPIINLQISSDDKNFLFSSYRKDNPDVRTNMFINWLVSKLYSQQVFRFGDQEVIYFTGGTTLALSALGMLPKNPWHNGESWADKNLMISPKHFQYAKAHGASCYNAEIVGQLSIDDLYHSFSQREALKLNIINKYFSDIDNNKPIIIYCMPQFFEHHIFNKEKSSEEIHYILDYLESKSEFKTLLSLHPKMDFAEYEYINHKYEHIKIAKDERLKEILPIADIYLAAFESTIPWAILCEVEPVFLDYYDLGFDPSEFKSCHILTNRANMECELDTIIKERKSGNNSFKEDKALLPPFDGRSGERILESIQNSIRSHQAKSA